MAKRNYVKKSDYWKKFDNQKLEKVVENAQNDNKISTYDIEFGGRGILDISRASRTNSPEQRSGQTGNRSNRAAQAVMPNKYGAIMDGAMPFCYEKTGVTAREAIMLCQHAYAKVPIVRNSVDLMAEFANGDIFLEGGNEASRTFFEAWFSVIRLDKIKSQYFLEYYRGSNIFFYKTFGTLTADAIKKLAQYMSSKSRLGQSVPIKYILLNPVDIMIDSAASFSSSYRRFFKILSEYELARLKNPQNEIDKAILDSFSPEEREKIKKNQFQKDGVYIELDPTRLIFSFAKKQDYEPFAIPFLFPVLGDVNMKLEMKKLDQAIMRTIENVVLLIKMGAEPAKGGINYENLSAMQNLMKNESVGRVLVADWTTEAEFIIPDIAKVVGKEKYEVLNEDIREGLQNIVTGDDKYASTAIKAQLFLERLNESRTSFLNDFLIPEMYAVANALGFKNVPMPRFKETTLKDEVQFTRAVTRLMELSILTPEQGIEAIKNGRLPDTNEFEPLQRKFKKQKDSGLFEPLLGGAKDDGEASAPKQQSGRPTGSKASISFANVKKAIFLTQEIFSYAQEIINKNNLDKDKSNLIENLCKSIIESRAHEEWRDTLQKCLSNPTSIPVFSPLPEILEIAAEHNIQTYDAALIYHGNLIQE